MYKALFMLGGFIPTFAYTTTSPTPTLKDIFVALVPSVETFVLAGFAFAVVVLAWGVVQFISKSGDDASIAEGRKKIMWGVVGIFILASVWGVIAIMQTVFGVDASVTTQNALHININPGSPILIQ